MRGILLTFLLSLGRLVPIIAQLSSVAYMSAGTQYVQNFDGLPSSGTYTLAGKGPYHLNSSPINATGINGWQIFMTAGTNPAATFGISTGSSTGNGVYSLGATAATDRALGTLSSSTGIYAIGLVLTNQTGGLLNSFTISFTAEQWRKGGSGVKNIWSCRYKTGNISQIDQIELTDEPNLNFGSVITTSGGSALNGNLPENRQLISYTVKGVIWKPGEQLLLRWDDADEAGSDDIVGMDNFSLSATLVSSAPVINNISVIAITTNAAQLAATVIENFSNTSVVFEYDTLGSFNTKMVIKGTPDTIKAGMGNTNVVANLSGLAPGTNYYYRTKAMNANGSVISGIQNFITAISLPGIITGGVFSVTSSTAIIVGNVTNHGGAAVTEKGIVWSANNNTPTIADNKVISGDGIGGFTQPINGLPEGTTIIARSYAINSGGIAYGDIVKFITPTSISQFNTTSNIRTNANTCSFSFKTVKNISGLSTNHFSIQSNGITGASVISISGSGNTYTITVSTGLGDGKIGIVFSNDSGISVPISNKPFIAGNAFIIDKTPPQILGVTIPDKTMLINDTVTATIKVKPDTDIYKMISGSIAGWSLSGLIKNNDSLYTANFTILNGGKDVDAAADIPVNLSLADSLGNISALFKDSIRQWQDQMDANRPVIISIQNPQKGTYKLGDTLHFIFRFSEKIILTTPSTTILGLTVGTRSRTCSYVSGNGTDSVLFRYIVNAGDLDKDGVKTGSNIVTGNGTIKDLAGNTATINFSNTLATKEVLIDGVAPVINSVIPPAAGIYRTGNLIDLVVNFSKKIYVDESTNKPILLITIGSKQKNANYTSGTGSNSLLFRYTVQVDDVDTNGIKLVSPLIDSSTSVRDSIGNKASLTLSNIGNMVGVKINPPTTFIESVLLPPAGIYKTGDTIDILVNYNERVWVTTDKGIPSLKIMIGNTSKQAVYSDGSGGNTLFFSYVVQPGDEDTDGILLNNFITLNSGTIKNENGYNVPLVLNNIANTHKLLIDGIAPTIKSVSIPLGRTYKTGDTLDFIFRFTENIIAGAGIIASTLAVTIGTKNTFAKYAFGNSSDTLVYRYIIQPNDFDKDGIRINNQLSLSNTLIRDLNGNIGETGFSVPSVKNILVDGIAPVVNNLSTPQSGIYTTGNRLDFVFTFSKKVYVINDADCYISVKIGNRHKNVYYSKGTATNSLMFTYRVDADDIDSSGIQLVFPLQDFSGLLKDSLGNIAAPININSKEMKGVYINPPLVTISKFITPISGLYKIGDTLQFQVEFSEQVIVSTKNGTPGIPLKINTINREAIYADGSGTNKLLFKYIVQQGDSDIDGIEIDSLILLHNGSIQNSKLIDAVAHIADLNSKNDILIDGMIPYIKQIQVPANGIYKTGDSLDFIIRFSEKIIFTNGTPTLTLTIGTKTKTATYLTGNGTDNLVFRYRIVNGDIDMDGIKTGSLSLNNSSIKDLAGNSASLVINNPASTKNILVDAVMPSINNIIVPATGIYKTNDTLYFLIGFSKNVFVSPVDHPAHLIIQIGNVQKEANYFKGSGTASLVFGYRIKSEDLDTNGISINQTLIDLNYSIRDSAGNTGDLHINLTTNISGILINPPSIKITDIIYPSKKIYITGDTLQFKINYSENVIVSIKNGTPYLSLKMGTLEKKATYTSGSGSNVLNFKYIIQPGDEDIDGLETDTVISLNNGSIRNARSIDALNRIQNLINNTEILIDGIIPFIKQIQNPAKGIYKAGDSLDFVFKFSEKIFFTNSTPSFQITIGTKAKNTVYISGNGTDSLLFRYKIVNGDLDADGIKTGNLSLNNSLIKDLAGNLAYLSTSSPSVIKDILVDAIVPVISNVGAPASGNYKTGDSLNLIVNFSENVWVRDDAKRPTIPVQIGLLIKEFVYVKGAGSNSLLFGYTIQADDLDTNGIKLFTVLSDINNQVRDSAGNNAVLTLNSIGNTTGIKINPPLISFIKQAQFPAAGIYKTGDSLVFIIQFSDRVFVNVNNSFPYIKCTIGASVKQAKYISGSGTENLFFLYIIQPGDFDKEGITVSNSITINGSDIKNKKGNTALLGFSLPNSNNIFADGIRPAITNVLVPNANVYKTGNILDILISFSEKVYITSSGNPPSLPLFIGNNTRNAVYINGSGSSALLFRYTIQSDDMDNDGIKLSSYISNNEASIIDSAGNAAILTMGNINNTSGIIVNPATVAINSIILPVAKTYRSNDTIDFILYYSEPVFVNTTKGTPSLKVMIGSNIKQVFFTSGSGSNYLLFRYPIQNGDMDTDGISLLNNLSLNNSTIKDARGNNAPIILPETANNANIRIDAVSPIIINIKSLSTGILKAGDTLDFQIMFSEPVFISNKEDTIKLPVLMGNLQKNLVYYQGAGTDKLSFRYIIQTGDLDKNGIATGTTLTTQNGSIKDMAGNDAITSLKTTVFTEMIIDAVAPVFVSLQTDTLLLCENNNATKINHLLLVNDNETAEPLIWKIKTKPLLGSLTAQTITANSNGKTVQCPLIQYTPNYNQNGTDSLLAEVSDGINISQKKILLIIQPVISNNSIGSAKIICRDQIPGLLTGTTPVGGDGLYAFSWVFASGTDSVNFTNATGNNRSHDYTSPQLNNNTWFRRIVQSGVCSDTSGAIKITVLKTGVWTGSINNDWNNSNNWCDNNIPNKSTDVLINGNTLFEPKITDTVWCNQLILSNATHLNIDGVLKINQTINAVEHSIDASNGTLIFCGNTPQNISGKLFKNATIQNLIIQNPSGVSITDSLVITGNILLQTGLLNTNNYLTIKSGAVFGPSATGTYINGIVYAEHKIEGGRRVYHLLGNPFLENIPLNMLKDSIDITGDKGSVNGFTNTITNQPSAFRFDPANANDSAGIEAGWQPFTHTNGIGENAWQTMHGIRLLTRGKIGQGLDGTPAGDGKNGTYLPEHVTIKLNGNIHSGDAEVFLTKNDHPTYHVIANPYISNIDLSYMTKGKDITANYWVWNPKQGLHGGYTSFPFRTQYILPPMGAFIVKTNGNLFNTLLFTENMKTKKNFVNSMDITDMNEIFHAELRLQSDSIFWDRILLLQMDSAKVFYDRNDAEKLWNSNVNFYSLSKDNKPLSIDARPFNNESLIPLGLQTDNPSSFTIKVTKSNLPPTNTLQLHDKYLNKWIPILQDSSYTFSTNTDTASFGNERFEIASFKKPESSNVQIQKLITSVYPIPAKNNILLQYNAAEAGNTTIRILDLSGTLIHSVSLGIQKQGQLTIPLNNLINGIYLVEIKCGNEISTQKIIKE